MDLSDQIIKSAKDTGFELAGISQLSPSAYQSQVQEWVDKKYYGQMGWFKKNLNRRLNPQKHLWGKAKSAIMVGFFYRPPEIPPDIQQDPSRGLIARYARYEDYHRVIEKMLKELILKIEKFMPANWQYHAYVDTGPMLEREVGAVAGLGFIGKNTTLINTELGSYFFVAEIVCDVKLNPSLLAKEKEGTCGLCTRCIEACPTQAFISPYQLDARRCISYLTIEYKEVIPAGLWQLMGNWIYGCDICQQVCPWNKKLAPDLLSQLQPKIEQTAPYLLDLAYLSENDFYQRFKNTPILRATWAGFMRNVSVALGNWGNKEALEGLENLRRSDSQIVRQQAEYSYQKIIAN